jgi:hypothetical protein
MLETTVDAYVRAFCEPIKKPSSDTPKRGTRKSRKRSESIGPRELPLLAIVFDTECVADDPAQALTFGSYAVLARSEDGKTYDRAPIESAFFYADGNGVPRGFSVKLTDAARKLPDGAPSKVISQTEFLERFFTLAVEEQALVCGFNLPFDVSRLARDATAARRSNKGGFSFILWKAEPGARYKDGRECKDAKRRPRVTIKSLGPRKSALAFSSAGGFNTPEDAKDYAHAQMTRATDCVRHAQKRASVPAWVDDGSKLALWQKWARALFVSDESERDALAPALVEGYLSGRNYGKRRGRFLDVSTLVGAITDRSYSLAGACEAFGVKPKGSTDDHPGWNVTTEYVAYNWNDVASTCELLGAALRVFASHPIVLEPEKAYSAASIGKAYFRALGITPMLERWPDFPADKLGIAASTFHGGSTGVAFRRCVVPVKYVDFLSMYSTVNVLLGTDKLLRAKEYSIVDCTVEVNEMLSTMTVDDMFEPATWKRLSFFAEVLLDGSGIFPVRAVYEKGDPQRIGFCYARSDEPRWFAGPDIVASFVLSGARPHVRSAFRIEPRRDESGAVVPLESLVGADLLGHVPLHPASENIFKKVIEKRQRVKAVKAPGWKRLDTGLKCFANATGYGVFAEVNVDDTKAVEMRVHSAGESFDVVSDEEKAGMFHFMPVASMITAAAHLMLALLESEVVRLGGTVVAWDTDSSAIISTQHGGTIEVIADDGEERTRTVHALSWAQVSGIVERFDKTLNPYDRSAVKGTVLKMEDLNFDSSGTMREVWMYAVSSKRYCMFELVDGRPKFFLDDKGHAEGAKESSLGGKLGPSFGCKYGEDGEPIDPKAPEARLGDWVPRFWETIVLRAIGRRSNPAWLRQHVVGNFPIKSAYVWKQFDALNTVTAYKYGKPVRTRKPYELTIKPYGFGLVPNFDSLFGVAPARIYGAKMPRAKMFVEFAHESPFFDSETGNRVVPPIVAPEGNMGAPVVLTFGRLAQDYCLHQETKLALPSGEPCGSMQREYAGRLVRRHVFIGKRIVIGKESTNLEDELSVASGATAEDFSATLSPADGAANSLSVFLPVGHRGERGAKRERVLRAAQRGCAGQNADSVAVESKARQTVSDPLAQARGLDRLVLAAGREHASRVRIVETVVRECGGVIADELRVRGKWARDTAFARAFARYRSQARPVVVDEMADRRVGNVPIILDALASREVVMTRAELLAFVSTAACKRRSDALAAARADGLRRLEVHEVPVASKDAIRKAKAKQMRAKKIVKS